MGKIQKIDLKSKDIKSEQVERLRAIFPEAVADGKINFEQLKATLGEDIEDSKERFGMTWAGKNNCFRIIQDPSAGTLKPDRKESINFDSTKNLFIEGDNLGVLKLLQKSYYEKVKMIYIDPPYNTGKDFVYNDKFGQQLSEYLKITGQTDNDGKKTSTNTDSSGRFHSNWMNMMYPRLFLARNLLKDDGVIFISIDDSEVDNLRKLCDEVFGEENFISNIVWRSKSGGANDSKHVAIDHEYILIYSKNIEKCELGTIEYGDELLKLYNAKDENNSKYGNYRPMLLMQKGLSFSKSLTYPIIAPDGTELRPDEGGAIWRWSEKRFKQKLEEGFAEFKKVSGKWKVYTKQYLNVDYDGNKIERGKLLRSVITDCDGRDGTRDLQKLFDCKLFNNPKSVKLISLLSQIGSNDSGIILDFFAGSGTTAHAVLDLNKEDNGNRKFICVQLPELTDEKSEAYRAGYKTIAEISKERIRRVIKNLEKESSQTKLESSDKKLDLGFKVFKLNKSNFKQWDNEPKSLQTSLTDHVEQIKKTANPEDVLYEVLIKDGFELTTDVKKTKLGNKEVFSVENNLLLICLDEKLDLNLFKEMKKLNPHVVIVLDKGFKDNDQLKTNAVQSLGKNSDEEYILRSI